MGVAEFMFLLVMYGEVVSSFPTGTHTAAAHSLTLPSCAHVIVFLLGPVRKALRCDPFDR